MTEQEPTQAYQSSFLYSRLIRAEALLQEILDVEQHKGKRFISFRQKNDTLLTIKEYLKNRLIQ